MGLGAFAAIGLAGQLVDLLWQGWMAGSTPAALGLFLLGAPILLVNGLQAAAIGAATALLWLRAVVLLRREGSFRRFALEAAAGTLLTGIAVVLLAAVHWGPLVADIRPEATPGLLLAGWECGLATVGFAMVAALSTDGPLPRWRGVWTLHVAAGFTAATGLLGAGVPLLLVAAMVHAAGSGELEPTGWSLLVGVRAVPVALAWAAVAGALWAGAADRHRPLLASSGVLALVNLGNAVAYGVMLSWPSGLASAAASALSGVAGVHVLWQVGRERAHDGP